MVTANCLRKFSKDFEYDSTESTKTNLLSEYERVVVESLITSFGLDALLLKDQHGGDVDTIHNVRKIDDDPAMTYKNAANEQAYENRGKYDAGEYHRNGNYQRTKHEARRTAQENGQTIQDEYTGNNIGFYGKTKTISADKKAELDHVISSKEIHEDRGRILAQVDGKSLADSEENLAWTNKSLNAAMKDKNIPDYIREHPEMDEATKKRMMAKYNRARKSYERKIAVAYYTSPRFMKDTAVAAANVGARMAVRQALGMVFLEMWIGIREEWQKITDWTAGNIFSAIGRGIRSGFESAMKKYKEVLARFKEGALAGILSSVTTTLCNIFFTTAKNTVRIIRQTWPSLVQAAKILFLNPDRLPMGEQIRAALKILSAGISVVVGTIVSELVSATGIGALPVVGDVISTFCGVFVTGIMGCTAVYILDNSEKVQKLVEWLNRCDFSFKSLDYFRKQAELFEAYAAQLMNIDIEQFKKETAAYESIADQLETAETEEDLNQVLLDAFKKQGIPLPWTGDFDEFMGNRANHLVFQ